MKKFLDPRVRLDGVTVKKLRDIQRWTGERLNTETVRVSVDSRWQHLKEEQDEREIVIKKLDLKGDCAKVERKVRS